MTEPIHTTGSRSTADSIAEGRMKVDAGGPRKKRLKKRKKKLLKKEVKKYY